MNTQDVSLTGVPRMGRATVVGALIGALSIALPVAACLLYLSGGDAMSIAAAVHVGFFGGMGYGGMLGAVIQADRFDRAQASSRDHKRVCASGQSDERFPRRAGVRRPEQPDVVRRVEGALVPREHGRVRPRSRWEPIT
jgi:hypothetical protein